MNNLKHFILVLNFGQNRDFWDFWRFFDFSKSVIFVVFVAFIFIIRLEMDFSGVLDVFCTKNRYPSSSRSNFKQIWKNRFFVNFHLWTPKNRLRRIFYERRIFWWSWKSFWVLQLIKFTPKNFHANRIISFENIDRNPPSISLNIGGSVLNVVIERSI